MKKRVDGLEKSVVTLRDKVSEHFGEGDGEQRHPVKHETTIESEEAEPAVTEQHVMMLIRSELESRIAEARPGIVDEATFAAAAGSRNALVEQAAENIEAIARVIRLEEKQAIQGSIAELSKTSAKTCTNVKALQKLWEIMPRPRKEDDANWSPYAAFKDEVAPDHLLEDTSKQLMAEYKSTSSRSEFRKTAPHAFEKGGSQPGKISANKSTRMTGPASKMVISKPLLDGHVDMHLDLGKDTQDVKTSFIVTPEGDPVLENKLTMQM